MPLFIGFLLFIATVVASTFISEMVRKYMRKDKDKEHSEE